MEVTRNVPIPIGHADRVKVLRQLDIGESVFIDVQTENKYRWRTAMGEAHAPGDRYFISRAVEGGVRIWRKA